MRSTACLRDSSSAPTISNVLISRNFACSSSSWRRFSAASPSRSSRTLAKGTTTSLPSSPNFTFTVRPSVSSSSSESAPQSSTSRTTPATQSPLTFTSTFASFFTPDASLSAAEALPGADAGAMGAPCRKTMTFVMSSMSFIFSRRSAMKSATKSFCTANFVHKGSSTAGNSLIWWLSSEFCKACANDVTTLRWAAEPTM
mmetsp:Transcript_1149/g.2982  ORF Transcript_1149/g.2982 Transcript_1149/m.2982 type:complete len:200 (-) Transcript_1149:1297-1896(-)